MQHPRALLREHMWRPLEPNAAEDKGATWLEGAVGPDPQLKTELCLGRRDFTGSDMFSVLLNIQSGLKKSLLC